MLVVYRTGNPFVFSAWSAPTAVGSEIGDFDSTHDEGHGDNIRGRIEGAYYDEPLPVGDVQLESSQLEDRNAGQGNAPGPVMQPSRLHNDDNEWRET